MALTKEERSALEHLRKLLSTEHLRECGFRLPGSSFANGQDAPVIAEATRLYRETWVLPLIDALLDDYKKHGYYSRSEALRHGI